MAAKANSIDSEIVSHQDETRRGVGATAHGVAALRHEESIKGDSALFFDPYAELLSGTVGSDWVRSISAKDGLKEWTDGLAVRTRKIDDDIKAFITMGFSQVCVLGAGLDTRPWRLYKNRDVASVVDESVTAGVNWFEVDFPEIFEFKLGKLAEVSAQSTFPHYSAVSADLSIPSFWLGKLQEAGFTSDAPTIWLLEGLTGYLEDSELASLLATLTSVSHPGSKIIATFLGVSTGVQIKLHRFKTDEPMKYCEQWGWRGTQTLFLDIASEYEKELSRALWGHYYLVNATLSE